MRGGFQLAHHAADMSLLEVVEAIEGTTQLNLCLPEGDNCNRRTGAPPMPLQLFDPFLLLDIGALSFLDCRQNAGNPVLTFHKPFSCLCERSHPLCE